MYLRRKIDEYLINWKNDSMHKPLIVKGAGQMMKKLRTIFVKTKIWVFTRGLCMRILRRRLFAGALFFDIINNYKAV